MTPATVTITARRNVAYQEEFAFTDGDAAVDLTGYAGALQVRAYGAQPGDAMIDLGTVADSSEGVRFTEPAAGVLRVTIDQVSLLAAYDAAGVRPGSCVHLVYDLMITPPGALAEIWLAGPFTIEPGVTI